MHVVVAGSTLGLVRGGLETVAVQSAMGLARFGHDVTVVTGRTVWGRYTPPAHLDACTVVSVPCLPVNAFPVRVLSGQAPGVALRAQSRSFLYSCRQNSDSRAAIRTADVTLSFLELETVALSQWRRKIGKPHVSYFPGGIRWSDLNRDVSTLRLATSETVAKRYRELDFRIDDVVAPGVEGDWVTDAYDVRPDASSLLYVGRLEENKGVRLLVATLQQLIVSRPDVVLTVVGTGPLLRWLRREVVVRGLSRNVRLLGDLPHHEVKAQMHKADMLVFPTRYESFGIVVLEAMAVGLPVVCSDLEVLRELTCSSSVLIPDTAPDVWKTTVEKLLSDESRRTALSQAGKRRAQHMTWSQFAQKLERHFVALM